MFFFWDGISWITCYNWNYFFVGGLLTYACLSLNRKSSSGSGSGYIILTFRRRRMIIPLRFSVLLRVLKKGSRDAELKRLIRIRKRLCIHKFNRFKIREYDRKILNLIIHQHLYFIFKNIYIEMKGIEFKETYNNVCLRILFTFLMIILLTLFLNYYLTLSVDNFIIYELIYFYILFGMLVILLALLVNIITIDTILIFPIIYSNAYCKFFYYIALGSCGTLIQRILGGIFFRILIAILA